MSCESCGGKNGTKPLGCNSNGGCTTGGCNKLNTYDWLATNTIDEFSHYPIVEVSFKNGARKEFFKIPADLDVTTGDMVVVDSGSGQDVGRLSLTGMLVSLQMKKKRVNGDRVVKTVLRRAGNRDMERLMEARAMEKDTLIRARAIARMLDLEMKVGDVEYQGDKRKATFYFTANGRVDFRELIRHYAKEFRVKIEMRQIGSRQESSRIGGIGSCGRELCCSTWLTTFKSVSTRAARYQNLAINQSKLSGQCGRLKCCLNYELDLYTESLDVFPMRADVIKAKEGKAQLIKVDIFKKLMYYSVSDPKGRMRIVGLPPEVVQNIYESNKKGIFPERIEEVSPSLEEAAIDFEDVTGGVELKELPKRRKNNRGSKRRSKRTGPQNSNKRRNNRRRGNRNNNKENKS